MGRNDRDGTHRVVVIGSGFGGLFGAAAFKGRRDVEVTVVAKTTHHLFQPLLYQVATGILSEGEVAPSTREILARQRNVGVVLGTVTDIDLAARTVTSEVLGRQTVTPYDSLIVAAGSGQSYFGHDEFAEYAPGMKSIDDALELRGRIFGAFEIAELTHDHVEARRYLTFVVVGAGPTGVEMAGQIAELSRTTLRRDFRRIDPADARVILVDAGEEVLPAFGQRLGGRARRRLESMGVEVRLGAEVVEVDATGLLIEENGDRHRIESVTKVWAAGVRASGLGEIITAQCGATTDRAGRVPVRPDLTVPGHPEVFVVGDMIDLDGLPGLAQVAIQGARYAARQITRRLDGRGPDGPFRYRDKGSMATISRFSAVASIGPLQFGGFLAWLLWLGVHLVYIIGFKHRVTTLLHWAITFLGRGRAERTITEQQVFARRAIRRLDPSERPVLPPPPPD
jgi:NADH dehydrogenase